MHRVKTLITLLMAIMCFFAAFRAAKAEEDVASVIGKARSIEIRFDNVTRSGEQAVRAGRRCYFINTADGVLTLRDFIAKEAKAFSVFDEDRATRAVEYPCTIIAYSNYTGTKLTLPAIIGGNDKPELYRKLMDLCIEEQRRLGGE